MKKRNYSTYCLFLLLIGCNGSSNKSPLLGSWVTESCKQSTNSSGEPQDIWLRGLYQFTTKGKILYDTDKYEDSDCISLKNNIITSENTINFTYQDSGAVVLQEGIDGGELLIEMNPEGPILEPISVKGFYTINNGTLCLSDAFTFEANRFGVSELSSDDIDFNNCLIRP